MVSKRKELAIKFGILAIIIAGAVAAVLTNKPPTAEEEQWLVSQNKKCRTMGGALAIQRGSRWTGPTSVKCYWDEHHPMNQTGLNALRGIRDAAARSVGEPVPPLYAETYSGP